MVDLGGAVLGYVVQLLGDAGIRLVVGSADERALRDAVTSAVDGVVAKAPPAARERLRLGLAQCFQRPPVIQARPGAHGRALLAEAITAQVRLLEEWKSNDSGVPFYQDLGVDPAWVATTMSDELAKALRARVAAGGPAQFVQLMDTDVTHERLTTIDRRVQEIQTVLESGGREPAGEPVRVRPVNVPHQGLFVGRVEELARLDAMRDADGPPVVRVVHGLGGVGKSTLAAHWAATHADEFTAAWWITADTPAAIDDGLASLAVALRPRLRGAAVKELTEHAMAWLAGNGGWLLVLDNVTDPANIAGLLSRARGGRVLVTSRLATGWHRITPEIVHLDVPPSGEAEELMTRILTGGGTDADLTGSGPLCERLGRLPLAIEQAAAYMAQIRTGPDDYLRLLAESPASTLDRTAEGTDSRRTVARTWAITLDVLARHAITPAPVDVLRILAWWAPEAIPRDLLSPLADPADLRHALGLLAAYNLITLRGDASIRVHRLVQTITRTPEPAGPHRRPQDIAGARETAARLLGAATPANTTDPAGWPAWRRLVPHATALIGHTSADDDAPLLRLALDSGRFLIGQGAIGQGTALIERGARIAERFHGDDALVTLISHNDLAYAYQQAGDLRRAIPLYRRTLAERERALGPNHPDTLTSRGNLAGAYEAAQDLERAIPLFEQTLTGRERELGPDHPDTLTSRNNLAAAYESAGAPERAIPLHQRILADRKRELGPDHPSTLVSQNNLACAYQSAGDLERAIPLHEQTLAGRERELGPDNPATLRSRNNLACAYEAAGKPQRAIGLHRRNVADRERVLGPDNPDTLSSRRNLAAAYAASGSLETAITLYESTLADCRRYLGDDHPITRSVLAGLRSARARRGR